MARERGGAEKLSIARRIRNRFRYGLATQEILDVLHRTIGLSIRPYHVVREGIQADYRPDVASGTEDHEVRYLEETDLGALSMTRGRNREQILERFSNGSKGIGIFVNGDLAAYTWFRTDVVPTPTWLSTLFRLKHDEAYLFDAYVLPAYRGRRLVTLARSRAYEELQRLGRSRLYSITLAFNASSHRFKQKLLAEKAELRLQLGLRQWKVIDVRLRRYDKSTRSPPWQMLSQRQTTSQN